LLLVFWGPENQTEPKKKGMETSKRPHQNDLRKKWGEERSLRERGAVHSHSVDGDPGCGARGRGLTGCSAKSKRGKKRWSKKKNEMRKVARGTGREIENGKYGASGAENLLNAAPRQNLNYVRKASKGSRGIREQKSPGKKKEGA